MVIIDQSSEINKVLITGITGFGGGHLVDYILENFPEVKILGLLRNNKESDLKNLEYLVRNDNNKVRFIKTDFLNLSNIIKISETIDIDEVYNLATQSFSCFVF